MDAPEIFDRRLRRRRRDRAAPGYDAHRFLLDHMADEIAERLHDVTRDFTRILLVGGHGGRVAERLAARLGPRIAGPGRLIVEADAGFGFAREGRGVQCDEDRLPFADAAFDLVVSIAVLDGVNDLPGALALIRRVLRPDGLFLGAFLGAGSLDWLRAAALSADVDTSGGAAPRVHPQIDIRSAGDLLSRAGFALQVADGDRVDVGYGDPLRLIADLRGMGQTNILAGRSRTPLGRAWLAALLDRFAADAGPSGRIREHFEIVYLTGWAPDAAQPKPARRGSATRSMIEALKPKG